MVRRFVPFSVLAVLIAAVLAIGSAGQADARAGRGLNLGSRGMNTFSAPPSTFTAPRPSSTFNRTITQPGVTQPVNQAQRPGLFGGLLGGLAAGLLGATLFHALGGGGFIQLLLIAGLVYLGYRFLRSRMAPAGPSMRTIGPQSGPMTPGYGAPGYGSGPAPSGAPRQRSDTVGVTPQDYQAFEQLLGEVQAAYSREDVGSLRMRTTPEMSAYFEQDIGENEQRGVRNDISGVKLLQGDLAEAWREGQTDYATVAMRFQLIDRMVDRRTGNMVEGSNDPQQAVELWTFRREPATGGRWVVSAIQQAS